MSKATIRLPDYVVVAFPQDLSHGEVERFVDAEFSG